MENIKDALGLLLTTIITGGLGIITAQVSIYFNVLKTKALAQADKIQCEKTKVLVENAITGLHSLIETNVISANETIVKTIKENSIDGYSKEDLLAVRDIVKENILKQLSDDSKVLIEKQISNVDSYVEAKIEEVLAQIKNQII